jgi:hypothetical protein
LLPPLLTARSPAAVGSFFGLGTIVPCVKHTAQLEPSMAKQNPHVNRVMNYYSISEKRLLQLFFIHVLTFLREIKGILN